MATSTNTMYCYHYNATGSTIALTDQSQTVVNKYAYDSFGKTANQVEAVTQPFKFVGQFGVMTEPNGFYYMRARYYDPSVGRFVSEDPTGFGGGDVNLCAYVGNNPIMFTDPWGLCSESTFWGAAEKIGGGILQAGQGLWNALGSEELQRGTAQGFSMAGKVAVVTGAAVAAKGAATYFAVTAGPGAYAGVMAAAGTPQGQKVLENATHFLTGYAAGPPPPNWGYAGSGTSRVVDWIVDWISE